MDLYFYFIFLIFFSLLGRKFYQKKYVEKYLKTKPPSFPPEKLELPPKKDETSWPEFLNYYAGQNLAEKVYDARLWDFEEKEDKFILQYYSRNNFSFFSLEIPKFSKLPATILITYKSEKIIPDEKIESLLREFHDDYFVPYKIIKENINDIESRFKIFKAKWF